MFKECRRDAIVRRGRDEEVVRRDPLTLAILRTSLLARLRMRWVTLTPERP